jgi:ornithine carbamoyltransferase
MSRNFIHVDDLSPEELYRVLDRADFLQDFWEKNATPQTLQGQRIALWFYGQGFRNRMAFEIGARVLGAEVSFIPGDLGVQEPLEDIGAYLDNWFTALVVRCRKYEDLRYLAAHTRLPVINARTDQNHPCEIVGDLQYIRNKRGYLDGLSVVFSGEVTNLCMSWFEAARILPIRVVQTAPAGYLANAELLSRMNDGAIGHIEICGKLADAVSAETDVLYTDCLPKNVNPALFSSWQITAETVSHMNPAGFFLPCPPVTRGAEITSEALKTPQFANFKAKNCLLHAQNALLEFCIRGDV